MMTVKDLTAGMAIITKLNFDSETFLHLRYIGINRGSSIRRLEVKTSRFYDLFLIDEILEVAFSREEQLLIEVER